VSIICLSVWNEFGESGIENRIFLARKKHENELFCC